MARFRYKAYLHRDRDEYEEWELDDNGKQKFSQETHESAHYALYEVEVILEVDTEKGTVEAVQFRNEDKVYVLRDDNLGTIGEDDDE